MECSIPKSSAASGSPLQSPYMSLKSKAAQLLTHRTGDHHDRALTNTSREPCSALKYRDDINRASPSMMSYHKLSSRVLENKVM